MRPLRRDPAPSRLGYRLERLRLTPNFWRFLRIGLPFLVTFAVAAIWLGDPGRRAALVSGAADLRREIETRPEFMVRLLAIEGATDPVAATIRERLALSLPASSFDLDLGAIRKTALEIDAVAQAGVRVRTGGVLEVRVTERVPALIWRGRDGLHMLDATGHVVAPLDARGDRPDLPLVAGDGARAVVPEAIALLAAAGPIEPRLRGLLRVGARRWDLVLDRDQRILLPETDAIPALQRVIAMQEAQDLLDRDIAVVDLRNPARPTIRMQDPAAATFRDIIRTSLEGSRP